MTAAKPASPRKPWYAVLYIQVLIAIFTGILIGRFSPKTGVALKPLGDAFVGLIRMMIAPVIFCVIVQGIAGMADIKKVGKVGIKTLIYFEAVSTLALVIGIIVAVAIHPGAGLNINPATLDLKAAAVYVGRARETGFIPFLLSFIPHTFVEAFTGGEVPQVLLISVLTGLAIASLGEFGARALRAVEVVNKVVFAIIRMIIRTAPLGALGGMAFTIGSYGLASLSNLVKLIATFYLTSLIFVVVVLGAIAALAGFSIFRFISYVKDELLIVLGTSSSETVLPDMMRKLEGLGVSRSVVGLVFPTGYVFNTDGTNIYLTLSALFLAQATATHLSFDQISGLLLFALLASKGGSGVTGTGFVTLAAILTAIPAIPVQGLALLVGIEKFMSECRALTNVIGNGVATLVVSRWQGELDSAKLREVMSQPSEQATPPAA
ncbi:MAG: dicarboxylate/amino acid:cation symporter [Acidobacteria bacterium]|nr:MAG: dicarboxylate/amino acid:cation symporter [Acidobacteria bacterium 13_2_20CM_58_27]PYT84526.1 MAG: dicarboxylate/amino acid:cation symporter [Acidobacteriota bacterium]